jgi:hypothetical protein
VPLRTFAADLLTGLLPWPLRWLAGATDDLPLRTPEAVFGECLRPFPFPLVRAPLLALETGRAPLRLPFVLLAPLAAQRAPETGREPLEVRVPEGRADELRVSDPGRRAVRLLEEDCAGLRSRE